MRSFLACFMLLVLAAHAAAADPAQQFKSANESFLAGEFQAAYSGYQQLLDDGQLSSDLLYNMGNTSYRLGRPGEAVLWYERTLTMDPTHKEATQNLRFLKRSAGLLRFKEPGKNDFIASVRRDTLIRAATFAGWLAILGFTAAIALRLTSGANTFLWIISPLLFAAALVAAYGVYAKQQQRSKITKLAIVTADESQAFTSPARSSKVITLPPGSQVERVSKRGTWDYVDIPGNLRGWIPENTAQPLWPYDLDLAD